MKALRQASAVILLTTLTTSAATSLAEGPAGQKLREKLVSYVTAPIPDSPRNRHYLEKIDRADLLGILDRQWLREGEDSLQGRLYATLIGQMAFAYHTPGTRWHKNRELLEEIKVGFRGFERHQNPEGRFVWPKEGRWEYQAHEHVWRLEPLILAYVWVREDLSPEECTGWLAMLKRAGEYLLTHPDTEPNNRGAVWCAGTALCGQYFEDERYLRLVKQHAPKLLATVLAETGEVTETQGGGGPDSNYSYVGFAYAYMYRLLMGADDLDERLLRSTRWLVQYTDLQGNVLAPGASTRKARPLGDIEVLLPALECYSANEPFLAWVADQYLEHVGDAGYGRGGLTVNSLIWGLLERRGGGASPNPPDWFRNHTTIYQWPHTHYLLIGRKNYQTAVTFRSQFALKGLQSFVWRGERPFVQATGPGLGVQSVTEAEGVNLSRENVAEGPAGWEVWMRTGDPRPEWDGVAPCTAVTRQQSLWTCYAFTPSSVVVVYGGTDEPIRTAWVLGEAEPAADHRGGTMSGIAVPGRHARLYYLRGSGEVKATGEFQYLEVRTDGGPSAFGFSDDSFQFERYEIGCEEIHYSDASGRYQLDLRSVLDAEGKINRESPVRLRIDTGRP